MLKQLRLAIYQLAAPTATVIIAALAIADAGAIAIAALSHEIQHFSGADINISQ